MELFTEQKNNNTIKAEEKKITFDSFIRGGITIAIIVGIFLLIKRLSGVLLPFLVAWLVAYMIFPLVKFFQYKLKIKSRVLSILFSFISISAVLGMASYFILPSIFEELGKINQLVVSYLDGGKGDTIPTVISDFIKKNVDFNELTALVNEENLINTIKQAVPQIWSLAVDSVNIIFGILSFFIILMYIVFILLDYEDLSEGWLGLLPKKYRAISDKIVRDIEEGMNRYFRGQALVALCVGVMFSIGFLIIDFPMAIVLGMFIGMLNMVPYLQIIGIVPTVLLSVLKAADTGENFWIILGSAIIVFAVVQIIQDGFLVPKIMGKITGLNPAIILLSLSIWGSLLGIIGMIIALPLTTLMLSYYQRFIANKEKIIFIRKKSPGNQIKDLIS